MTVNIWTRLMKLNRLNDEQYKNDTSKFEWKIPRYVDFIADFRLRSGTRQFGTPDPPKHTAACLW